MKFNRIKLPNKAFTLIELLAVIIILGVLMLIAIPSVTEYIGNSRRSAFLNTSSNILDNAKKYVMDNNLTGGTTFEITDGEFTNESFSVKGMLPDSGTISVNTEMQTAMAVTDGTWCAKKGYNENNITITNDLTGCVLEEENNVAYTSESCFSIDDTTGTIVSYFDNEEDNSGNEACPRDIVIPKTIDGVDVTFINTGAFITTEKYAQYCYTYSNGSYGPDIDVGLNYVHTDTDGYYACYFNYDNTTPGSITSVVIPDTVTYIRDQAFTNNQLTSVTIPDSVTKIGKNAFSYNNLTSVTIPSSVTNILSYAFYENQITDVDIPSSMLTISHYAFAYNQIENLNLDPGLTAIGICAFCENKIASVTIPNTVTTIYDWAFGGNAIQELTLPDSITSLRSYAFNDNLITEVHIPNTLTTLTQNVFANNLIESITIPNTVTTIGVCSFCGNKISTLVVPSNVTLINSSAFRTNLLTSVTLPNSLVTIADLAFEGNNLASITIPSSVTSIGSQAFWTNSWGTVTVKYNGVNLANRFDAQKASIGWTTATMNYVSD